MLTCRWLRWCWWYVEIAVCVGVAAVCGVDGYGYANCYGGVADDVVVGDGVGVGVYVDWYIDGYIAGDTYQHHHTHQKQHQHKHQSTQHTHQRNCRQQYHQ